MDIIKKPYEISLWEDVLTFIHEDGHISEKIENGHGKVVAQYYKEHKICVIGSDTMEAPIRAVSSKFVEKVNGENILTFDMYSHYYDEEIEEHCRNPFIDLLFNERKIKFRYGALGASDTKWYDLIIKNVDQNSESKTYSYTAKDLFVNELSKSGFNIEFNQELENNVGSIEELAETVLKESDWKVESSDILKQTVEEPLYAITLKNNSPTIITNMEDPEKQLTLDGGVVYAFYNSINTQSSYVQLLYVQNGKYEYDSNYVITNSPNWYIDGVKYNNDGVPNFANAMAISNSYRGRRLVRRAKTEYDATIDKYVNVYQEVKDDNPKIIYGYTETEYFSPTMIQSYVTNSSNYDSDAGWEVGKGSSKFPDLEVVSVPDIRDVSSTDIENGTQNFTSCLRVNFTETDQILYNSGIVDFRQYINGFVEGEPYIFRIKYGKGIRDKEDDHGARRLVEPENGLTLTVAEYRLSEGRYVFDDVYFQCAFVPNTSDQDKSVKFLISVPIPCAKTLSYAEMIEKSNSLGFFVSSDTAAEIYIEDVQFFPYVNSGDPNNSPLLPNEVRNGEVRTLYYYYEPNPIYSSLEQVKYVYRGTEPSNQYREVYNDIEYEKRRSITASESNRFNLIQDLCEIFECWPKFRVERDESTGEIKLDENDNYRQKKYISFHEYVGQRNDIGFKYGINLKQIQRTIDSEGIVSKLIVKNNSNEFATDGFCTIARADENPTGENFILDFNYYVQREMLSLSEITNDLYLEDSGWLGYYKKLKRYNALRDSYIKEQSGLMNDISKYQASLQAYEIALLEAEKQYRDKEVLITKLTGLEFGELVDSKDNEWWENEQVIATSASLGRLRSIIVNKQALKEAAESSLKEAQDRFDQIERMLSVTELDESNKITGENVGPYLGSTIDVILNNGEKVSGEFFDDGSFGGSDDQLYYDIYKINDKFYCHSSRLLLEKQQLNLLFYKKYSRFLQEGTWISEDYIDDNLYYLDAQSTLTESSKPKVTYNISVLELSQLEEYENYSYALGDETDIEDSEFFGWTMDWTTSIRSPAKESVVVTELTYYLDSPELNQIKVQNYKSQFEDLFQRMAATTQTVEYSTGKYQKVSNIVESDGTINISTLQSSFANNALVLSNAKDQSVVWDETGITTTSLSNPAEIIRIVSGGVFLSTDGGLTWNTGITGGGINANYITTGQLNVEKINVMSGSFPSFRWDSTGLNAYKFEWDESKKAGKNFDFGKFVRLDQYGLYGINNIANFNPNIADSDDEKSIGENKIWKHADFALTWKGFQIKSNRRNGGYISITSDNDLQVFSAPGKERVKLGFLGEDGDKTIYGLCLTDDNNNIVMTHGSDGKVWIKNELTIGNNDTSSVSIGYLDKVREGTECHEVINAYSKFIVYEDGKMIATDGEFTGTINATGGTIGGVSIETIVPKYEVIIESNNGTVFRDSSDKKQLTAKLYKGREQITSDLRYQWYKNGEELNGENNSIIEVGTGDVTNSAEYSCKIVIGEEGGNA